VIGTEATPRRIGRLPLDFYPFCSRTGRGTVGSLPKPRRSPLRPVGIRAATARTACFPLRTGQIPALLAVGTARGESGPAVIRVGTTGRRAMPSASPLISTASPSVPVVPKAETTVSSEDPTGPSVERAVIDAAPAVRKALTLDRGPVSTASIPVPAVPPSLPTGPTPLRTGTASEMAGGGRLHSHRPAVRVDHPV